MGDLSSDGPMKSGPHLPHDPEISILEIMRILFELFVIARSAGLHDVESEQQELLGDTGQPQRSGLSMYQISGSHCLGIQ